jgi:cysteine desulfurase
MPDRRVYLDHAATTPLDERVLEAMIPYLTARYGNPSSVHQWGQEAEAAVEGARRTVAECLGCYSQEIVFTSGGSESDNLALRGAALAEQEARGANRILTTPVEHPAVLRTAENLAARFGFELDLLPVDETGRVNPGDLVERLRDDTAIVSIIYANNEIGSVNAIRELGAICRERGVPFHTDAVQAASQLTVLVDNLNVDLMSMGAHKFYGPKGVGALYIRQGLRLAPVQTGGGQEMGHRAGTHNVPLIVGMAEALRITHQERSAQAARFRQLREVIIDGVLDSVPESRLTGHPRERLPNHASFAFRGVDGNALLTGLDIAGFGCSSGSACKTGDPEPSSVLTALGLPRDWALGSLRVTVGRATTQAEIGEFLEALPAIVRRMRAAFPIRA